MPEVLKLSELAQDHGETEMDVGRGWVDSKLNPERTSLLRGACQQLWEPILRNRVVDAPHQQFALFVDGWNVALGHVRGPWGG